MSTENRLVVRDWASTFAAHYGDRTAIVDTTSSARRQLTYDELDLRASAIASWLKAHSIGRGACVAVIAPSSPVHLDVLFACAKVGARYAPMPWPAVAADVVRWLDLLHPACIISDDGATEVLASALAGRPERVARANVRRPASSTQDSIETIFAHHAGPRLSNVVDLEDIACLLLTGGTTGDPKAARISYGMIAWNALGGAIHEMSRTDVGLSPLPLYHAAGLLVYTLPLLILGGTVVVPRDEATPEELLELIGRERVSIMVGVPRIYHELTNSPAFPSADLSALRFAIGGGASMPPSLSARWRVVHGVALRQAFGMTEFGPLAFSMPPSRAVAKAETVGLPNALTCAEVRDSHGRPVGPGEAGHLVLRGPVCFSGYLDNDAATKKALPGDGWLHTGDIARVDSDGYFRLLGRKDDTFSSRGEEVYPEEIRAAILAHPGVEQCAVLGVPDAEVGHVAWAFVVAKEGSLPEEAEIVARLAKSLKPVAVPARVIACNTLPTSAAGKYKRATLLEWVRREQQSHSRATSNGGAHVFAGGDEVDVRVPPAPVYAQTTKEPLMNTASASQNVTPVVEKFIGRPQSLLIDGKWVDAHDGRQLETMNPATGKVLAKVASAGEQDIDRAVRAARRAYDSGDWRRTSPAERQRLLLRVAELIEAHAQDLSELETLDNGKPIGESRYVDVPAAAETFRYYAGWATKLAGETQASAEGFFNFSIREPIGVCGLIIPWNFPLLMAAWKLAPALACGNTCVLKPAEETPLSALFLGELLTKAGFPPGVVNIAPGLGETAGRALVRHPMVDKIAFTGSTEVGKEIQREAAGTVKRLSLELGGKSPNIVFADADLAAATTGVMIGAFFNQGEVCCGGSRLLVERRVRDELVDAIANAVRGLRVGDGLDPKTQMGPLVSREQHKRVTSYLAVGKSEGARAVVGGNGVHLSNGSSEGYFAAPTVFVDAKSDMRISQEEIFGPVLTVLDFETESEAIRLANDSRYGLAAGVWTRDLGKAHRVSRALQAGTVWVNCYNVFDLALPFGGYKESGYGRESGREALDLYTQKKAVCMRIA